jgi:hypothetical protein
MATVAKPPTLKVALDERTNANGLMGRAFASYGSDDLIRETLAEAGITGQWTIRVLQGFKACSKTPRFQVRNWEATGVHIWTKPKGNDSGFKTILLGDSGNKIKPMQAYNLLRDHLDRKMAQDTDEVALDGEYEEDVMETLVAAVDATQRTHHPDRSAFLTTLVKFLPFEPSPAVLNDMIAAGCEYGWLVDNRVAIATTPKGDQWLSERIDAEVREQRAAAVTAAPPAKPTVPTASPVAAEDSVALVKTHRERLKRLLALPDLLDDLDRKLSELRAEIAERQTRLASLVSQADALRAEFDPAAIQMLVGK